MTEHTSTQAGDRPSQIPWPAILFPGAIVAALALGRLAPIAWPGLNDLPARVIGYGIGIAGVVLVGWGMVELVRAKTAIRPDRGATSLVTSGPFQYGRNPIYAGEVMVLLGLAQVTLGIWFVVVAATFGILVHQLAILREERYLEARFGEAYRAYKNRTRRWI